MSKTVVIGAGVIGLACAYALNKRGREVVVLDQGSPANICSLGNAGWIVPSLSAPLPAPGLTLTDKQAKYLGVDKAGPYKPEHYRY